MWKEHLVVGTRCLMAMLSRQAGAAWIISDDNPDSTFSPHKDADILRCPVERSTARLQLRFLPDMLQNAARPVVRVRQHGYQPN
jgi:hypothetical protein